jgi:Ser/Thr protein kinase RdoA (MazF antagonist)
MDTFPAQYSTLSSVALKTYIDKIYNLNLISLRLLIRNVNDVYIAENADQKFILKIYRTRYRTPGEINGEVELLDLLKGSGIPVSYAISDSAGRKIQTFQAPEGKRYGVLFSFAVGAVVPVPDETQLRLIGRQMARMHNVTAVCKLQHERITYDQFTTLEQPLKIIQKRFENLSEAYDFLKMAAGIAEDQLKTFDLPLFGYGYCHYDLLPKNFHFDEENNITFFDFDWAGKGYLVNDLMTFFVQLFFLIKFKVLTQADADSKFSQLVAGYRENRNLSDQELKAIPYLGIRFWIFAFGFYEENYDDFSNTFLTTRFIQERVELIKKWVEWYC